MNDDDLIRELRSVHLARTGYPDAADVHHDVLTTRIEQVPQLRGLLPPFPRWRGRVLFHATSFIAAAAVVALVGGFLLSSALMRPSSEEPVWDTGAPASPPAWSEITPGSYTIPWGIGNAVHITVPGGWLRSPDGTAICNRDGETECPEGSRIDFTVHDFAAISVARDVCRWERTVPHQRFEFVGGTVDELVSALTHQVGTQVTGPETITLGGYPAKSLVVTLPTDDCAGGPEGRALWQDASGPGFGVLFGGIGRIYVVDVDGLRLVITSSYRGASPEDIAQLDSIVDSVDIELGITGLDAGRHSLTVDGVPLSFRVSTSEPGGWAQFDRISINKSILGPQGAEAIIYWTSFPDGAEAQPCADLAGLPVDASASDLATTMASEPGTELISGPSDVTVGGRPAQRVVVKVLETNGCDPGFFYTWEDIPFGSLWSTTEVGDTIRAWIVDVDGKRLVIVGETHEGASTDPADTRLSEEAAAGLDAEIDDIIDSIRFE